MNTEDLFKYGVTPKEGSAAGQRFLVSEITKEGVKVKTENEKDTAFFTHGSYDLWTAPKTLFEDGNIEPTWGNLKKAMEAAGLDDDTVFVVPRSVSFAEIYVGDADFSVETMRRLYEKPRKFVVIR